jgi:hypothetical protein
MCAQGAIHNRFATEHRSGSRLNRRLHDHFAGR